MGCLRRKAAMAEATQTTRQKRGFSWREILTFAAPVMLAYVGIGVPCGVMEQAIGLTPFMVFVLSCTFYSGAGQFIIPKMWLGGSPLMSIALTTSFINTRQILYSTAFSPWVRMRVETMTLPVRSTGSGTQPVAMTTAPLRLLLG